VAEAPRAYFHWFEYTGHDAVFDQQPLTPGTYRNPVLAGFYPDPSITRAGSKFYLVNSSFTYFPGIPVFESDDLVHWHQIGHVIDRPGELDFDRLEVSRGLYAPTIRYYRGMFYVVCTAVDSGGNFLSIARSPAGPWSDPIWLPGIDGIDPSLFFDADDKVYLLNNGLPEGRPRYQGHRAIWIQELDLARRKLTGPRRVLVDGGTDIAKQPLWIEGPHMYRRDGWYYLMCAEGGTYSQHSEVIFRARSPWGPFKPHRANPILTQRDLPPDRPNAVANVGHADLIEAIDGSWWAVFLGSRTYEGVHYNTGRETYMLPVTWADGWPSILAPGKAIPYVVAAPQLAGARAADAAPLTGNFTWRDDFNSPPLQPAWLTVRVPKQPWADLTYRPGWLTIHALSAPLESLENMSFLARRQQHLAFDAITELETPTKEGVSVGLAAFQNGNYWYFLGVRQHAAKNAQQQYLAPLEVFLERRAGKSAETVASRRLAQVSRLKIKIAANARRYSFYVDADGSGWKPLKENEDGTILSTAVAGGFVGAFVGPYARVSDPCQDCASDPAPQ
jgi:alpha-N-arabinofuranosidase